MATFAPIKRSDLIRGLRQLGFVGPSAGGKHEFMLKEDLKVILPNPHRGDISKGLLARLLRQAGITQEEWQAL